MSFIYCTVLDLDERWHVAFDQADDTSRSFLSFDDAMAVAREAGRQRAGRVGMPCLLRVRKPSGEWTSEVVQALRA